MAKSGQVRVFGICETYHCLNRNSFRSRSRFWLTLKYWLKTRNWKILKNISERKNVFFVSERSAVDASPERNLLRAFKMSSYVWMVVYCLFDIEVTMTCPQWKWKWFGRVVSSQWPSTDLCHFSTYLLLRLSGCCSSIPHTIPQNLYIIWYSPLLSNASCRKLRM